MHDAGYFTAIRGKVSHSTPYHPYKWDLVLDTLPDGTKAHVKDPKSYGISTSQAIAAAGKVNKPFCLMVNISDPHKPFYSQGKNGQDFDDPHVPTRVFKADEVPIPGFLFDDPIVRKELAQYYSSVRRADDCVGSVLKALESRGKTEETFIMFLSDHGMPLPFAKTQLYHHSTHTPLIVRWPGVTRAGAWDREHMVSAVDFLPTLLDVLGIEHPQGMDGRSFAPLLRGRAQDERHMVFKEYNENSGASRDPMRAVQTRRWLYVFNPWSNGERIMATATTGTPTYRRMAELAGTDKALAARHDLYQYRVVEELYDVQNDPDCLQNLIDDSALQPELAGLRKTLELWMVKTGDHALAAMRQRNDPTALEAYVQQKEREAQERRAQKRKAPKQPSPAKPQKRLRLIALNVPKDITAGQQVTVRVRHRLEAGLGTQLVHVTLKAGAAAKRVERKVVKVSGKGVVDVSFTVPADVSDNVVRFAAFIGKDYASSLQRLQTPPKQVQ